LYIQGHPGLYIDIFSQTLSLKNKQKHCCNIAHNKLVCDI
jgi:hypothetical protein